MFLQQFKRIVCSYFKIMVIYGFKIEERTCKIMLICDENLLGFFIEWFTDMDITYLKNGNGTKRGI